MVGIGYHNLCIRAVEILNGLEPYSNWNAGSERNLRDELSLADLKLSFRRLRTSLALKAFDYIVAELIDSGVLGCNDTVLLKIGQENIDFLMSITEPVQHRDFIYKQTSGTIDWSYKTWLDDIELLFDVICYSSNDGKIVIGEQTCVRKLE